MLRALGVQRLRLITNNPDKHAALGAAGLEVVELRCTGLYATRHNRAYLEAKRRLAGHALELPQASCW
jgi:GTP cyclohydrolase II